MFARVTAAGLAAVLFAAAAPAVAQGPPAPRAVTAPRAEAGTITADDLRRHIAVLASDRFEGRAPGTEGERLTTDYIVRELAARGVIPAGPDGAWLQPVPLVERGAGQAIMSWRSGRRTLRLPADGYLLGGRDASAHIADAPVIFAGHGAVLPSRGIDQLAGADFRGAVALVIADGPEVDGFPSLAERMETLSEAGAVAVIAIMAPGFPFADMRAAATQPSVVLDGIPMPAVFGAISFETATALFRGAGRDLVETLNAQPGSSFRSIALPLRANLDVATPVRRFTSNNVVGRIRGSGGGRESVLLLAHWDHLGLCRPEGSADRICNGAIDNASGVASLIEAAGQLARGPQPVRDVLILATTAEELGLLGADQFARTPPVPLRSILAAINVDTAAIAPAGTPVAVIGHEPRLEQVVSRVARALGRNLDPDREADPLEQRQDGWALARHGVPSIMAGGSFSDMARLGAFLGGAYHGPDDELTPDTPLAGAAEDADLLVALARAYADPAGFPTPPPSRN